MDYQSHWTSKGVYGHNIGDAAVRCFESAKSSMAGLFERYKNYSSYYRERLTGGFDIGEWMLDPLDHLFDCSRYNIIRICIDTLCSRLAQQDPTVEVGTFGASIDIRNRGDGIEKLIQGVIQNNAGFVEPKKSLRDSLLYGIGWIKFFEDDGQIKFRRVHPSRVIYNDNTCLTSPPTELYYYDYYHPDVVKGMFDDSKAYKIDLQVSSKPYSVNGSSIEMIKLIEAWDSVASRHIVFLEDGIVLLDEEWTDPIPLICYHWNEDIMGFSGLGLAENLESNYLEIKDILENIHENRVLNAPFGLIPVGSKVVDEHLGCNINRRLVEYDGMKPEFEFPPVVHEQEIQLLNMFVGWGFEVPGLSQMSATSKQPANFESGAAIRTYMDVESIRFADPAKRYEYFASVELGKQILASARRLASADSNWSVTYFGDDKVLQKIKWADVNLEKDKFQLRPAPVSMLPSHPAARLDTVMSLANAGRLSPLEFKHLIRDPDLEKFNKLADSEYENAQKTMEYMLSEGAKYIKPQKWINLELWMGVCAQYYHRANIEEYPEEAIERLERWMSDASAIVDRMQREAQQAAMEQQQAAMAQQSNPGLKGGAE